MSIRQSYTIAHGGKYSLGDIGRIGKIHVVSITVNGKLIRYASHLTWLESGTPLRHYIEIRRTDEPTCAGMVMVNKEDGVIETFISSDKFYDSVVVTLDIHAEGES